MNKSKWNTIIYILVAIVITIGFLKLVPYLVIFGIVIWGTFKIYKFFNKTTNRDNDTKNSNHDYKVEDDIEDVSEVIDVDYKDV